MRDGRRVVSFIKRKYCALINRLKTRPQGTLETLVTNPMCIFSLKTPREIQDGKGTFGVTSLAVLICFSTTLSKNLDYFFTDCVKRKILKFLSNLMNVYSKERHRTVNFGKGGLN